MQNIPESTWPGPDDGAVPGGYEESDYKEEPQATAKRWTPQKRRMIAVAALILLFVSIAGALSLVLMSKQNKDSYFEAIEMQPDDKGFTQTQVPSQGEMPGDFAQRLPQQNTEAKVASTPAAPAAVENLDQRQEPLGLQEASSRVTATQPAVADALSMSSQLEAISSRIVRIEGKLNQLTFPDAGKKDSGMANALQVMTEDMQKLAKENEMLRKANNDIQEALRATERKVDKLTQENERFAKAQPKGKKESKKAGGAITAGTVGEPAVKWTVMGLAADRVVIQDENGKIHALEAGNSHNGVKILSVDLVNGDVKTSAGVISYLKK